MKKDIAVHIQEIAKSYGPKFIALVAVLTLAVLLNFFTVSVDNVLEAEEINLQALEDKREILWLARAIYSETKFADEQRLVAWVIRNRVESQKYPDIYHDVVLQPSQFSGLHPSDDLYALNITRTYGDTGAAWESALKIAKAVYHADATVRPMSKNVWHFYSPNAVRIQPEWATHTNPVLVVKDTETNHVRFAFHANVK